MGNCWTSLQSCLTSKPSKPPYSVLGTPMPDTPSTRQKSRSGVGYGSLGGLEREQSGKSFDPTEREGLLATERAKKAKGGDRPKTYKERLIQRTNSTVGNLTDKYIIKEVLGVGSTSTCHKCVCIMTGKSFACKIIDKKHIEQRFRGLLSQFHVEIEVLKELQHPNIIRLEDVYSTNDKIYMIMEMMGGGELFDYVVDKGTLTEEEASRIVNKVTSAVVYMHSMGIIHRDLKPENLLLTHRPGHPGDIPEVKIIDFGLSKFLVNGAQAAKSFLGTRGYLAPEMLQRKDYSKSVDIWALGVIVFVLLCGCLPFDDDSGVPSDAAVKEKFILRFPKWAKNLSDSAKDLLMHLLDCDPSTRYTAEQALAHPWVTGKSVKPMNFLQSPRIIQTPRTPAGAAGRSGQQKKKDRVADLLKVRQEGEGKDKESPNKKKGGGGKMQRQNSL
ncbi:hypothetical protein TrLO_g11687 [Triparma laevis f. longispina]|uniref:non-specific serine/threonine protein kinase n=2 Tax=Triparma laevis TaxID=1534972 RepID=A0A9W7BYZ4_9STRA|nr:hypothetical protein TrLO_g11687 [Triparma laevis f. longispina]